MSPEEPLFKGEILNDTESQLFSPVARAEKATVEDKILENEYLREKTEELMAESERLGFAVFLGDMTRKEWDELVEKDPNPMQLQTAAIYERDGRTVAGYKVWRMDLEAMNKNKEKADDLVRMGQDYYRRTPEGVEAKKEEKLKRQVNEGKAEFLGELSLDEYASYRREEPAENYRLIMVFDKERKGIKEKYRVYRLLNK